MSNLSNYQTASFYFTGTSPNSAWDLGRDFYFELLYNVGTDRTPESLEEGLSEFTLIAGSILVKATDNDKTLSSAFILYLRDKD